MKKINLIKFALVGLLAVFALGCSDNNNPTSGNGGGGGGNDKKMTSWNTTANPGLTGCVHTANFNTAMLFDQPGMTPKEAHSFFLSESRKCVNQFGGSVYITYDDGSSLTIQ